MTRLFRKLKIEITVNGNGFDNPNSGNIKKQKDIWTASLSYPNPQGKMFEYFQTRDEVRIYLGLDELPSIPTFTGFLSADSGENLKSFSFHGRLSSANRDNVIIDNNYNLDGMEVSQAIKTLIGLTDTNYTLKFTGTNPEVFVPSTFRYDKGENIYTLIKKLRDMAYDNVDYSQRLLYYFLYEEDDKLYFRKEPELIDENSWFTITGGDNLLSGKPKSKTYGVINKQTVIGDGVKATYRSKHRIAVDGVLSGKTINNEKLKSAAECYEKARVEVENNKFKTINTNITALEMIDAVPGLTIIKIQNAKNIVNGLHRVRDINMSFGRGFQISSQLEKDIPAFGLEVFNILPTS